MSENPTEEKVGGVGPGLLICIRKVCSQVSCLLSLGISSLWKGKSLQSQQGSHMSERQKTEQEDVINRTPTGILWDYIGGEK